MIISDIFKRNAKRYPRQTAAAFGSTRLNFAEFNRRLNSLANALINLGLQKQDKVAIILDNCLEYLELYCALPKAGCVAVPLNTSLSTSELTYIINNAEVKMLVFSERFAPMVASLLPDLDSVGILVGIGTMANGAKSYEQLITDSPPDEPNVEVGEEDLAYLLYSSGTTGLPKGVMTTHRGIIESAVNYVLSCDQRREDVCLIATPLFWGAAPIVNIVPQFYVGGALIIADDFSPEAILGLIQKEKVTIGIMAPPMIMSLLEHPQLSNYDTSSLRHIWFGGLPMPVESLKRALQTLGNIFFQVYGMIEISPLAMTVPEEQVIEGPPEKVKRLASCGKEPPNVEVRVVNDEGKDVAPGEVGEVIGRGDNLMKGYWRMPQATEEALRDGYLHTGDLATIDEDGYMYMVGRKKDLIVSGGNTIYPAEIEEVIYQHPSIIEAALIGVPDEELGEVPMAVVVVREPDNTAEDILAFCQQKLPDYACPRSVTLVEKLPRNPAGKVLRKVLQEKYCS
ncbi:long-chain-fatty-acid--CoA ligase [Bacteroidota bacterium]